MKNSAMKKRIASVAAAAVMSITSVIPSAFGISDFSVFTETPISVSAAESSVVFSEVSGYAEGAYAEWSPVADATGYNVYCDGTQIDSMLIRQYSGYFRADVVGLAAGTHTLKVVPVISGIENSSKSASTSVTVTAHDRSGYAFDGGSASGAYNDDGTLKSDAIVVYVTEDTKDTVTASLNAEGKGEVECTGIQNIILAYKKGKETRPISIRIIGNITDPSTLTKGDLYVDSATAGMTIEGIGSDATLNGFGLVLKNCENVEVRNLGFMNCDSSEGDDCGLQQGNSYCWVHNCDFFYGDAGSDADQVKGDGALDTKKSNHITHSYNHFYDNGKCNLQGANSSDTSNYITYHHNWYDHSDSRHPRVRVATVHVYNNYYDGNAKYGIGSTTDSDIFAENNYFRNCNEPMLISSQGTEGGNVLSGETGGMIKAYGNIMTGTYTFVSYSENSTDFDAYVASSRDETVPSSVTAASGGATYNNFDTASDMYDYEVDDAEDVPAIVTANAGRVNGGDFQWEFDDSTDDTSYAVDEELKAALVAYDDSIIAIGSGFTTDSGTTVTTTTSTTTKTAVTTTTTKTTTTQTPVTGSDVIYCSPSGGGTGKTIDSPTDVLTAIDSVNAGGTIYLLEGTYEFSETIVIDQDNCGSAGAYKTISAYPGADVVFDFSSQMDSNPSTSEMASLRGIVLDGSYWKFYGFEITKAGDNGMLLSGNNNQIEMMVFNDNQDSGLQISRYRTDASTIDEWPSNNLVLNCTSKNNCDDATMENADGFAAKLTCGEGNVFDGCISHNNSDDGWDLFAKEATGSIGVVTIQNCVAFRNGFTEFGEGYGDCDGNGFKLGGSGVGSAHIVKNCLAFENLHCGFTDNNNPKLETLINCTAVNNNGDGSGKPNFSCYRCTDDGCDFVNVVSYYDSSVFMSDSNLSCSASNDKFVGTIENSVYYNSGYYQIDTQTDISNGDKLGTKTTSSPVTFISVAKAPEQGTDFHTAWRNSDGSINTNGLYETTGDYASMGYHFTNTSSDDKDVTTATTASASKTTTTTTTTKSNVTVPAGGYVHDFTENGTSSSFYTISGNLSTSKGTVEYAGKTLTQCLKIETATSITFTSSSSGTLTLVFAESAATIKVDGTKYTSDGTGIITVELAAGSHSITKADTANLFYMIYSEDSTTTTTTTSTTTTKAATTTTTTTTQAVTTTTAVTTAPTTGTEGDANCDGEVTIADAVLVMSYVGNSSAYPITAQGLINADVYGVGDGLSNQDALSIQKFVSGTLTSLPES